MPTSWGLYMAECPSVLPSASIRIPPCRTCVIAPGTQSLNCAAPKWPQTGHRTSRTVRSAPVLRTDSESAYESA
eukprot:9927386-Alexandrium_andersonii.AAC.1